MMSQYESFTQCQNQHGPSIEVMRGCEKSLRSFKTGSLMVAVVVLFLFSTCSAHSSTSTPFCTRKDYIVLRLCYSHRVVLCWAFSAGRWGICRTCHLGLVSGLLQQTRGDSQSKTSSQGIQRRNLYSTSEVSGSILCMPSPRTMTWGFRDLVGNEAMCFVEIFVTPFDRNLVELRS